MTVSTENILNLVDIRIITYGSDDYNAELQLRDKVLRKPLGMSLFDEDLLRDKADIHIAAFYENILVGCLLLLPVTESILKMRQVAVDETFRSKGLGGMMVVFAEKYAQNHGFKKIELHARETAVAFYQKHKYAITGNQFFEVGIPHRKMLKLF